MTGPLGWSAPRAACPCPGCTWLYREVQAAMPEYQRHGSSHPIFGRRVTRRPLRLSIDETTLAQRTDVLLCHGQGTLAVTAASLTPASGQSAGNNMRQTAQEEVSADGGLESALWTTLASLTEKGHCPMIALYSQVPRSWNKEMP